MRWWECGSSHLDRKKQYFGFPSNFTVLCLNVGQMQLPQFYYSLRDKDILINIHRSSGRIFFHSAIRRPLVLYLFLWRHFPVSSSLPFPHGGRRSSPAASASPDLPLPMGGGSSQSAATRERGSASASQEVEGSIRREHQQIHRRLRKVRGGDYNTGKNVLCHRTPHHPIIRILARQQTRKEEGAKRRLFVAEVETGGNYPCCCCCSFSCCCW